MHHEQERCLSRTGWWICRRQRLEHHGTAMRRKPSTLPTRTPADTNTLPTTTTSTWTTASGTKPTRSPQTKNEPTHTGSKFSHTEIDHEPAPCVASPTEFPTVDKSLHPAVKKQTTHTAKPNDAEIRALAGYISSNAKIKNNTTNTKNPVANNEALKTETKPRVVQTPACMFNPDGTQRKEKQRWCS